MHPHNPDWAYPEVTNNSKGGTKQFETETARLPRGDHSDNIFRTAYMLPEGPPPPDVPNPIKLIPHPWLGTFPVKYFCEGITIALLSTSLDSPSGGMRQ